VQPQSCLVSPVQFSLLPPSSSVSSSNCKFIEDADWEEYFLHDRIWQPIIVQNKGLHTIKLDNKQSLCLLENVICLDYVIRIEYYHPTFDKLYDVLFKRDAFFKGVTNHPMISGI